MKNIYFLLIVIISLLSINNSNAQVVDGISYQAVAIDANGHEIAGMDIYGNPLNNKSINVRFSILSISNTGSVVYQETHTTNTDINGLFSLVIGHGEITINSPNSTILDIDWSFDKHFLKVEIDIDQTDDYKLMGIQQMMAVPYALFALNASNITSGDVDTSSTNEIQNISISNDTLFISDGGFIILPTDKVDDADADSTNEIQTITRVGLNVTLSNNGGTFQDSISIYTAGNGIEIINNEISVSQSGTNAHYVGELFGGGIVFYVYDNGNHGLIASLHDLDNGNGVAWSGNTTSSIGVIDQSYWNGYNNTVAILTQDATPNKAATLCNSYSNSGFSDWYLPSILELSLLYNSSFVISTILANDGISNTNPIHPEPIAPVHARYWSSTQSTSGNFAWYFSFALGSANSYNKSEALYVRAIRSF